MRWLVLCFVACGGSTSVDAGTDASMMPEAAPCAVTCPGTSVCDNGACACTGGKIACESDCVDIKTDPYNCGGCGRVCYVGSPCVDGACGMCPVASCPCPPDKLACIATKPIVCTDWSSDPNSCGQACRKCGAGEVCHKGQCTTSCPTNMKACGGTCCDTTKCIPRPDGTTVCGK